MAKMIKVEEAVGEVLLHDITKVDGDKFKGRIFKKEIKIFLCFSFPNIFLKAKSFFGSANFNLPPLHTHLFLILVMFLLLEFLTLEIF